MKRTVFILMLLGGLTGLFFLGVNCGGGSGSSSFSSPEESLLGTYTLESFNLNSFTCSESGIYNPFNEIFWCRLRPSLCDTSGPCTWVEFELVPGQDMPSYTGTLVILADVMHEALTFSGTSQAIMSTYEVTYTNGTSEGTVDFSGASTLMLDGEFICTGNMLTLTGSEMMSVGLPPFIPMMDVMLVVNQEWMKISDSTDLPVIP